MKALMLSTAVAKLSTKDVKMAFQETKNGISSYMTNVFDSKGDMSQEFDDFTKFGSKLEPMSGVSIREKDFENVIFLLKKLNIRAMINAMGPMDKKSFDERKNGLFPDAIKDYGCHCLPNQGNVGIGAPVDELDRVCFEYRKCRSCLEYDGCKINELLYGWQVSKNKGKKEIFCSNSNDKCQQNLCHCENHVVEKLISNANFYNPLFSKKNGFDRSRHCGKFAVPVKGLTTEKISTTTTPSTSATTTIALTFSITEATTSDETSNFQKTSHLARTSRTEYIEKNLDEYEAEEMYIESISKNAYAKLLEAQYPTDSLLQTTETMTTITDQNLVNKEPLEKITGLDMSIKIAVKMVAPPVVLKLAKQAVRMSYIVKKEPASPKCCGEYPHVEVYNPERRKCCDGFIRSIGSC